MSEEKPLIQRLARQIVGPQGGIAVERALTEVVEMIRRPEVRDMLVAQVVFRDMADSSDDLQLRDDLGKVNARVDAYLETCSLATPALRERIATIKKEEDGYVIDPPSIEAARKTLAWVVSKYSKEDESLTEVVARLEEPLAAREEQAEIEIELLGEKAERETEAARMSRRKVLKVGAAGAVALAGAGGLVGGLYELVKHIINETPVDMSVADLMNTKDFKELEGRMVRVRGFLGGLGFSLENGDRLNEDGWDAEQISGSVDAFIFASHEDWSHHGLTKGFAVVDRIVGASPKQGATFYHQDSVIVGRIKASGDVTGRWNEYDTYIYAQRKEDINKGIHQAFIYKYPYYLEMTSQETVAISVPVPTLEK